MYKGGDFSKEVSRHSFSDNGYEKKVMKKIINNINENEISDDDARKIISSMLYLVAYSDDAKSRESITDKIINAFPRESGFFEYFSVFGDFFSLDFSKIKVSNGYFNGYGNIWKSNFPEGEIVFFKTKFLKTGDEFFSKNVLSTSNFNRDCELDEKLDERIKIAHNSVQLTNDKICNDIYKIFKVGFRSNSFSYKSHGVYKTDAGNLKSGISLDKYLSILLDKGFLLKEKSKNSDGYGYRLTKLKEDAVRNFLTQSIRSNEINEIVRFLKEDGV
jgi:hypothetical protein